MDVAALRALVLSVNFVAHGEAARVTVPGGDPVETTIIWLTALAGDEPVGQDLKRRERRRSLALMRSEVASAPLGTLVEAAEVAGGPVLSWKVAGYDRVDADRMFVVVVPSV